MASVPSVRPAILRSTDPLLRDAASGGGGGGGPTIPAGAFYIDADPFYIDTDPFVVD